MKAWSVKNGACQHCFGSHDKMHDNDAEGCMKRPFRENSLEIAAFKENKICAFQHFMEINIGTGRHRKTNQSWQH